MNRQFPQGVQGHRLSLWLLEWDNPVELERALAAGIEWYYTQYLQSALGYRTPSEFERQHELSHSTQFVAS